MMDNIYDLLDDPNCMSESDRCIVGLNRDAVLTRIQLRAMEAVIDLLCGPLRQELLRQARELIVESRNACTFQSLIEAADWSA
jgi:hypothetical protein